MGLDSIQQCTNKSLSGSSSCSSISGSRSSTVILGAVDIGAVNVA